AATPAAQSRSEPVAPQPNAVTTASRVGRTECHRVDQHRRSYSPVGYWKTSGTFRPGHSGSVQCQYSSAYGTAKAPVRVRRRTVSPPQYHKARTVDLHA